MTHYQGFQLHPGAAEDINEIWTFIAQNNLTAAARFREVILQAIRKLAAFPHRGHKRPDLTSQPLRFYTIREHMIVSHPTRSRCL